MASPPSSRTMSSFSAVVYNELDVYPHTQSFNAEYLPTPPFQSEPYESAVDPHAFGGGSAHYPSPLAIDQYTETYPTPNSGTVNLEGHAVAQDSHSLHVSHTSISQGLTVHPIDTTPYVNSPYYHQPPQAPTPPYVSSAPTPSVPVWDGPPDLTDQFFRVLNSEELRTNLPLPKNKLIPFLRRIRLPESSKGRGSRQGAQSYICLWPQCGKELARRDHGTTHIAGHFGSKPFICGKCDRKFLRVADRRRHIKSTCIKREVSVDSSTSNNSGGSSTSGSGSGEELVQPSRYASQTEVWRSIMGSWRLCLAGLHEKLVSLGIG